jgi:hypothetical protein
MDLRETADVFEGGATIHQVSAQGVERYRAVALVFAPLREVGLHNG